MPTKKVVLLYKFDELSDKAKEKARDWFRKSVFSDNNDWDYIFDDAEECAKRIGLQIRQTEVTLMSGKKRWDPVIYFSGFSSQGDGACFEGTYSYIEKAGEQIRDHAPEDKELHRIADRLDEIQKENKNLVTANMVHRGHYSHSNCMEIDVENADGEDLTEGTEKEVSQLMRDFADWIYQQLEKEHDYQMLDETVDENIRANEYTFLANGKRED